MQRDPLTGVPVPGSYDAAACTMQTAHTPDDRTAFVLRDRAKPAGISKQETTLKTRGNARTFLTNFRRLVS